MKKRLTTKSREWLYEERKGHASNLIASPMDFVRISFHWFFQFFWWHSLLSLMRYQSASELPVAKRGFFLYCESLVRRLVSLNLRCRCPFDAQNYGTIEVCWLIFPTIQSTLRPAISGPTHFLTSQFITSQKLTFDVVKACSLAYRLGHAL